MLPILLAAATAKATALPITLPPNFTFDQTPHSPIALHAPWLTHILAGLFIILGVLLVVLLALQTTKQEGLSGTLGGRVEASTRRLGLDQQIARVTQFVAVSFVVTATLVSLTGI